MWVDAICINQSDMKERNHQVKLMAHIFSRAEEVLVWLGLLKTRELMGKSKSKNSVVNPTGSAYGLYRKSEVSPPIHFNIAQELWAMIDLVEAATKLRVHWALSPTAHESELWENFVDLLRRSPRNVDMTLKLADQREGRHGDSFLLANLIETCQDSLCEEPRDKIYGFIGIAHDCQDDSLPVDYSKSLLELYEDVIRHEYHWARENPDTLTKSKRTIMHLSQVVQKVLGGPAKMHQDDKVTHLERNATFPASPLEDVALNFDPFKLPNVNSGAISISSNGGGITKNFDEFTVTGIHTGLISTVGPTYSEIIGDLNASRTWKSTLSNCKMYLSMLRRKSEGFMRTLLQLNSQDLARVCSVETGFWWKRDPNPDIHPAAPAMDAYNQLLRFKLANDDSLAGLPPRLEEPVVEPRLFLTRNGVMGLMPPTIRSEDLVFQFWNSDTVAIVRRDGHYMKIVGRGVVANQVYSPESKFEIPLYGGFDLEAGIDMFVDITTLQLLTQ